MYQAAGGAQGAGFAPNQAAGGAQGGASGNMIFIINIVAVCATTGISGVEGKLIRTDAVPWFVYYIICIVVMTAVLSLGLIPAY